ncbi:phytoene desaturase family protein [Lysinimonas soli]|uniref:Phytoene desaturase family protein n=1 Tax=Lysinimonas soli TaxID=1074233 RepID=A0ABW0NSN7_9MICO
MSTPDAIVVGAGPNGLAAAVTLARAGLAVELYERAPTVGGGARTAATTDPGFLHDLGSAVHPMALASPFFRAFGIEQRVDFVVPEISYAHPLDGAGGAMRAGLAWRELDRAAAELGRDGRAWHRLFAPLVRESDALLDIVGDTLLRLPRHPLTLARFGLRSLEQGGPAWNLRFRDETAPAMLGGLAAHAAGRMPHPVRAGAGLLLGALAHARGWPIPVGGSQAISDALAADFVAHGGRIHLDAEVADVRELPAARAVLLDVAAPIAARIAAGRIPDASRRRLARVRFGAGVFRLDLAVSAPIPWRDTRIGGAGTVHLGGTRSRIAEAERRTPNGLPPHPFVLLSQPTLFDPSRAPAGRHTVWAYTHVPAGSAVDAEEAILATIEAAAPGFRDTIIARASRTAPQLEQENPSLIGGDISGGLIDVRQTVFRPRARTPWAIGDGVYLASSSAAPGPGVNGLAGWRAALSALGREFGLPAPGLGAEPG